MKRYKDIDIAFHLFPVNNQVLRFYTVGNIVSEKSKADNDMDVEITISESQLFSEAGKEVVTDLMIRSSNVPRTRDEILTGFFPQIRPALELREPK